MKTKPSKKIQKHYYKYGGIKILLCKCGLLKSNPIHRLHKSHCISCLYKNNGKHEFRTFEHPAI